MTRFHSVVTAVSTVAIVSMVAFATCSSTKVQGAPPPPPGPPPNAPTQPAPITPPTINPPTLALSTYTDPTGQFTTINGDSAASTNNPFFQPLGTNGRACITCHSPSSGWTITPAYAQSLFDSSQGLAPLFRTVDGANSPNAPVATLAERQASYSELLTKGLIRIGLPIPSSAQFTLASVDDPYGFASEAQLSLFRRPLPTSNLSFLSTVMFDGRETITGDSIAEDLAAQAENAIETHEQAGMAPTAAELQAIVTFESANFSAQSFDSLAGILSNNGATGGPGALSGQNFYPGINATFGGNPTNAVFNPVVFTDYSSWQSTPGSTATAAQQSIARGEQIFNTRPFTISNVPGLNDVIDRPSITGTCTTCHNTPNVGDHSLLVYIDLGLSDQARATPDLPLYTLRNTTTGAIRVTTDPGRALITGQWSDIGKFKVPTLRGLAARAPYFHNGSAPSVNAVIAFYNQRFNIGFTPQEQTDLGNFLNSL